MFIAWLRSYPRTTDIGHQDAACRHGNIARCKRIADDNNRTSCTRKSGAIGCEASRNELRPLVRGDHVRILQEEKYDAEKTVQGARKRSR